MMTRQMPGRNLWFITGNKGSEQGFWEAPSLYTLLQKDKVQRRGEQGLHEPWRALSWLPPIRWITALYMQIDIDG